MAHCLLVVNQRLRYCYAVLCITQWLLFLDTNSGQRCLKTGMCSKAISKCRLLCCADESDGVIPENTASESTEWKPCERVRETVSTTSLWLSHHLESGGSQVIIGAEIKNGVLFVTGIRRFSGEHSISP